MSLLYPFNVEAAQKLPSNIRLGTSTWTYHDWEGLIYQRKYKNEKEFKHETLYEYSHFPLFRTVGIDSFFYMPPSPGLLKEYAAMVPAHFQWVSKVWEQITVPVFPSHPRYGKKKGTKNTDFLSAELFQDAVLQAYDQEGVREKTGPFVFQFPHVVSDVLRPAAFFSRLSSFLLKLPPTFRYSVEVRNKEYLVPEYFHILNEAGATHCFNHWSYMPSLKDQMKRAAQAGGLKAPFYVSRVLTPLGLGYSDAVEFFKPYNSIKEENPSMREDVQRLIVRGIEKNVDTYIIINNRAEGCSPITIDILCQQAVQGLG